MTWYSVEHTTSSKVLSVAALLLVALSYFERDIALGLVSVMLALWSLTFVRIRVDRNG